MAGSGRHGYRLGPRVPLRPWEPMGEAVADLGRAMPSHINLRRADDCKSDDPNLCEKPASSNSLTLPLTIGLGIPMVAFFLSLIYFHRRNVKRQRLEDQKDPHKSLDFGLNMDNSKNGKRRSKMFGSEKNPSSMKHRQMSMDMNLSSPYLLPPELHQSRESLHSLARTLHQNEDPYRPVTQYTASEVGSMRSFPMKEGGSSVYTSSTSDRNTLTKSRSTASSTRGPPPRQNSLPGVPPTPTPPLPAHVNSTAPDFVMPAPPPMSGDRFVVPQPIVPVIETAGYPDEPHNAITADVPVIQEPQAAVQGVPRKTVPGSAQMPPMPQSPQETGTRDFNQRDSETVGLGLLDGMKFPDPHMSPPPLDMPAPLSAPIIHAPLDMPGNWDQPNAYPHDQQDYEDRGRPTHRRQSSEYPQEDMPAGLNVPQQNNKRLSVGFRPLPPDEVTETEDPETRANRIRSFYKEYFDESAPRPAMPPLPAQGQGGNQYYEDYDQGYLGDTAFFDPEANAFVMPYAQPVARRAMTPPPTRSRFPGPGGPGPRGPGPRGPPRGMHGSMGGMSMPGGRGPPRPGSSVSNNWGPGPRPGSSASNQWGRPRAGSAISARGPRKPMPPPAALSTLPTPSKLKDDSFAILGAIDFAPPPTFRDQASGRPQSPLGERRPYSPALPAASPLVSAFDEMAALPSPHLLRKSSTFTGLDFAPPRKFKDADTMSDAGSIRSNRSGISTAQLSAIRGGAGRVSRLPGDSIFTQAAMGDKLKPNWGMRD